jgi:hypothetical protein
MQRLKYDLDSQNFDLFFQKQLEGKELDTESGLPNDILFKLHQGGGNSESYSTSKMSGFEKMFVLWKLLGKQIFVAVEDDEEGIGIEEYIKIKNRNKKTPPQVFSDNGTLHFPVTFIKSNKELSESFSYYNLFCNSPFYRYALAIRNKSPHKLAKWKKEMRYLTRLLLNYESTKLKACSSLGLAVAEIYVLLYLYDEEEKQATPLYKEMLYKSHGAGTRQTKAAFVRLRNSGLILKTGETRYTKFKITPLGLEKINTYIKKYVANL